MSVHPPQAQGGGSAQTLPNPALVDASGEDRQWAEAVLAGEKRVLEMLAGGSALGTVLDALCRVAEEISTGSICSILLLDAKGERLWHGAAPSLPKSYAEEFNGREIASCWGPCGAAAFRKKQVIAADIRGDPQWERYRHVVLSHGVQACWSTPIFSSEGKVLGTFAILSRAPCSPTLKDQKLIERFTHLASIAIERSRGEEALHRSEAYLAEAQRLSHTGSFGWNVSSGELMWSAETFCILGYDRTVKPKLELVLQRVHPEDLVLVHQMIDVASREGTSLDFEHRLLMPDGLIKHLHVLAHATKSEAGELEFVGAVMDVSERKRGEALVAGEKRLLEKIARGGPLAQMLDALCRYGEELSGNVFVSILLVSSDGRSLRHGAAPSLPKGYIEAIDGGLIGPKAGSCGTAAYRRETVLVSDIATDSLWDQYRHLALRHGLRACWSAPIFSTAREVMGTFALYSRKPGAPTPHQRNVIEQLTHLAAVAIERERAEEALRRSQQSRQAAVVAERNRMARDIHDTLAQGFTGVIVQLEAAADATSEGLITEAGEHIARASELARGSLQEARRSVRALRPQALEDNDLGRAMEGLINKMTTGTGLKAELICDGESGTMPPLWGENLLRIGQEVLTNSLRHASASEFKAKLSFDRDGVYLTLGDNGCGFDPAKKHDGFGLLGIRERVESMGGQLSIQSGVGEGTRVFISLPYADNPQLLSA